VNVRAESAFVALSLFACSGEPDGNVDRGPPEWQIVLEGTSGAVLRTHGSSANDVWIVGADGDGRGPLAYHYDGTKLEALNTGATGDLWWVQADLPGDSVKMVGEAGLIVTAQRSSKTFSARKAPTDATLFGVWGSSASDLWLVGGESSVNTGLVYRDDGTTATLQSAPPTTTSSATIFKVQGFGPDAVWMVGQRGRVLFWDGSAITDERAPTNLPLIAIHGVDEAQVYAVGGVADGVVLRREGSSWINETPEGMQQMNGVWALANGDVYTAGFNGHIWRKHGGVWAEFEAPPTFQDFHAIWVDPEGGIWAAGGRLASNPPKDGVLVYYGPKLPDGVRK
jgi:hypothetical protein